MNKYLEKIAEEGAKFQPVNPAHKGLLHKEMGIPEGEHISEEALRKVIATTTNPHTKRRAQFALNARKWHHAKKAENLPPFNEEYTATGTAVAPMADNLLQSGTSGTTKIAEQKWTMSLDDAIEEHKDLAKVLKSNNRKAELKELKEQGGELKEMLAKKAEYRNERTNKIANRLMGAGVGIAAGNAGIAALTARALLSPTPGENIYAYGAKQGLKGSLPVSGALFGAGALLKLREMAKERGMQKQAGNPEKIVEAIKAGKFGSSKVLMHRANFEGANMGRLSDVLKKKLINPPASKAESMQYVSTLRNNINALDLGKDANPMDRVRANGKGPKWMQNLNIHKGKSE